MADTTSPHPGWKHAALIPIIVAVITLFGGFLISSIASVLYKPDVSIELIRDKENIYKVAVDMKNKGSAAAKNLKLTMESPYNITSVDIFSTENFTKGYTNNSAILQVNVPRFVQGEGSIVRINASIDSDSNITDKDHYIVYGTHDQGSKMDVEYILAATAPRPTEPSFIQRLNDFINAWAGPLTGFWAILSGIVGVIAGLLQYLIKRRREDRYRMRYEEDKSRMQEERERDPRE